MKYIIKKQCKEGVEGMSQVCYIFLDIDGVLNDETYIIECYKKHNKPMHMNHVPFNPKSLNVLMELCQSIEKKRIRSKNNIKQYLEIT